MTKKKDQTAEETSSEIINIVKTCKDKGVREVFVSSLTCRPNHQEKIKRVK